MTERELMRMKVRRLFPLINGLFTKIDYQWPEVLEITPAELDLVFITNWGLRTVAPVVMVTYEQDEETYLQVLADLILHMFKYKWDKLADVLALNYDPIHNYSDTYHEEITEGIEGNETLTHDVTVATNKTTDNDTVISDGGSERKVSSNQHSDTRTDNLTERIDSTGENNLFGFNSDEAVGADTDASHRTRVNSGTQGNSGTGSNEETVYGGLTHTTDGTVAESGTKSTTGTEGTEKSSERNRVRDLTHLGNIGNITTQQLITQEIELWRWNYIQAVLNDVKDFLTIPVYD